MTTESTPIFEEFTYINNTRTLLPLLEEPPYKFTKFGKKNVHRKASTLWNKLQRNLIKTYINFKLFEKILKKCIIDNPIV